MAKNPGINDNLERYTLNNIEEVVGKGPNRRYGSDAEIVELNWNGTPCVGKKLHPVFFQEDTDPNGAQCLVEKFRKEINLLSGMKHPNIVQFLGLYYQTNVRSSKRPIMVMEKMDYSLTEFLRTHPKGCIPQEKVIRILIDIARGLVYLHVVQQIAHRDLSSNNILVNESLSGAKIADFGSARILDIQSQAAAMWTMELTAQPGTQDFMPPEALEDPPRYGLSVDVFSFGCVIIHLTSHKWPKPSGKLAYHYDAKILSEWERRFKFISEMGIYSSVLQPIVEQCLKDRDYHRPSSKEVLSMLEDISRAKHWMKPLGANQPCGDNNLGLLVIKDYYRGDTCGKTAPLTMNSLHNHHNYASGKLHVFDRAIECIQQLEMQFDQQQEKHHQREFEMDTRLRDERNKWQEDYAAIIQQLEVVTEDKKRLKNEKDELETKYKKLKCDYKKARENKQNKEAPRKFADQLERMHSLPVMHHQPRALRHNHDDDRRKSDSSRHQSEVPKLRSHWSTQAVYNGHPGKDDGFLDTL